ncbi:MAG: carboxypeptidase regulatory-like domain-containing protein [Candidatus Micrarchaeia archaeon]|jgi:hypothetical protein
MRNGVLAFALIAILSMSFAQLFNNPLPVTGTLDVKFVDVNGNPIVGATVDYTYIISGTAYTADTPSTGTAVTDADGRFTAMITADGRQTIPFEINLTYQGVQVLHDVSSSWLTYADRPATITVNVGSLTILVKDAKGNPIQGVSLAISGGRGGSTETVTNEKGEYAISAAEPGAEYTVVARYGNSEVERKMTPPATMELEMPAYDLTVRSVDDNGNRIEAGLTANITALDKKLIGSGELVLKQVPLGDVYIVARYGKAFVEKKVTVSKDATVDMVLDLNAPKVASVVTDPAQPGEAEVFVSASIDDGTNGVGIASVVLKYRVGGGEEKSIAMAKEGNVYNAAIPRQPAGAVVMYYVESTDKNGNGSQSEPASYIVKSGAGTGGSSNGQTEGGFGWLLPVIGVVGILAVVGFVLWRRRRAAPPPMSI